MSDKAIREGFGEGLLEAGKKNDQIVGIVADLTESTKMNFFADKFPERFFEAGVAEQNIVTVGSGMAAMGKIPFVSSYAAFSPGRNWEQIRTTICLNDMPVKIVGSHAGISVGPDGATHQMLEDLTLMRVLPNMIVIAPGDAIEAKNATMAIAENGKPTYIRLAREATPVFLEDKPFDMKAQILKEGQDISLMATGTMTYHVLKVAEQLEKEGISADVLHIPVVKPLDEGAVIQSAKKTGLVITAEEAQVNGGFGSAITELLAEKHPTKVVRVGMQDRFGESGEPDELLKHFGLDTESIYKLAKELTGGKN